MNHCKQEENEEDCYIEQHRNQKCLQKDSRSFPGCTTFRLSEHDFYAYNQVSDITKEKHRCIGSCLLWLQRMLYFCFSTAMVAMCISRIFYGTVMGYCRILLLAMRVVST